MKIANTIELMERSLANGDNYFSEQTMEFFDSIVYEEIFKDRYFITSEQNHFAKDVRRWTIRSFKVNGDKISIGTVGEFAAYDSYEAARDAVEEI